MSDIDSTDPTRLSGVERLIAGALVVLLLVPWGVAGMLRPDGRGYGTHQQLGLPPCSVYVIFGCRCPTCGGTTAWSCLIRGRCLDALAANVGATLLGVLDLVAAPWLLVSAVRGRWVLWNPSGSALAWIMVGVAVVMVVDWAVRLAWH